MQGLKRIPTFCIVSVFQSITLSKEIFFDRLHNSSSEALREIGAKVQDKWDSGEFKEFMKSHRRKAVVSNL